MTWPLEAAPCDVVYENEEHAVFEDVGGSMVELKSSAKRTVVGAEFFYDTCTSGLECCLPGSS